MQRIGQYINLKIRQIVILVAIALTFAVSAPSTERTGDNLQFVLPILGLACDTLNGRGLEYLGRFVVLELAIHGPKNLLGDAAINERPRGGYHGFPSGHTAAAAFGATALVQRCVSQNIVVRGVIGLTAAFVGGSRIEADAHFLWQVIAGAVVGWFIGWVRLDIRSVIRRILGGERASDSGNPKVGS